MKSLLQNKRRIFTIILKMSVFTGIFMLASQTYAASSYVGTWEGIYPASASANNASCQLCHAASTQNLNPYGQAICASTAGSISNRIQSVEAMNSDIYGDTGADNLTEINASTQPGWTPGNINPTYSRSTCVATGVVESPLASISGDLDPAANVNPIANAGGPYNGTTGIALTFDGTGSSDPDGSIISYDWDFGDGATGTGATTTHTYTTSDTYFVSLTVTDNAGASATNITIATIGVGNQPPVADANGPYTGTTGVPVAFDGTGSIDPDGSIVSYSWDFGDGATGTGATPTHIYNSPGTYNVTLEVMDDAGAMDSVGTTASIVDPVNQPPTANAGGPYSGTTGIAVDFDGTGSSDPDGSIISYSWDFGDGSTGTGATPSHIYTIDGNYLVNLTVTDNDGASDTMTTTASIGAVNQPPVSDPNGPYSGTVGVAVAFDGTGSNDPDGSIVSYSWDFGDGATGTGATPVHTYSNNGTFNVTLTVTDDQGDSGTASTTAAIGLGNQPPVADPNGPYSGTVGVAAAFDGTGSSDPDGSIISYSWDFGDGSTGTGDVPTHAYTAPGTYNVTLTVTDDAGATDSAMTTVTVTAVPTGDADVYLMDMDVPADVNIRRGRRGAYSRIKVTGDGNGIAQSATVKLSANSPDGVSVSLRRDTSTRVVSPDDGESSSFRFSAVIRCLTAGDYSVNWSATISAAQNSDVSNDTLTGTTSVHCAGRGRRGDDDGRDDDRERDD